MAVLIGSPSYDPPLQGFCVCIDIVKSVSASYLLQNLKAKGVRSPDVSRALGEYTAYLDRIKLLVRELHVYISFDAVKEKLRVEKDSEISATCLRVSLLCPVSYYIC